MLRGQGEEGTPLRHGVEGSLVPGVNSSCSTEVFLVRMEPPGLYPSTPPASPVRALGLPLSDLVGMGAVCDGVQVAIPPLWMDLASLVGPRRSISYQNGIIVSLATFSLEVTNVPPARAGFGTPVHWAAGHSACPTTTSPRMGTCVADALAGGFPGVSSGSWQPSPVQGFWGHSCAHQWRFVLLCLVGAVAGTGFQSLVKLSRSLLPFSSVAAGWAPPCRGFLLTDLKSHFPLGASHATAPALSSV